MIRRSYARLFLSKIYRFPGTRRIAEGLFPEHRLQLLRRRLDKFWRFTVDAQTTFGGAHTGGETYIPDGWIGSCEEESWSRFGQDRIARVKARFPGRGSRGRPGDPWRLRHPIEVQTDPGIEPQQREKGSLLEGAIILLSAALQNATTSAFAANLISGSGDPHDWRQATTVGIRLILFGESLA
jgi:hypothetical protein